MDEIKLGIQKLVLTYLNNKIGTFRKVEFDFIQEIVFKTTGRYINLIVGSDIKVHDGYRMELIKQCEININLVEKDKVETPSKRTSIKQIFTLSNIKQICKSEKAILIAFGLGLVLGIIVGGIIFGVIL